MEVNTTKPARIKNAAGLGSLNLPILLLACAGILLSVAVWAVMERQGRARVLAELKVMALDHVAAIESEMILSSRLLQSVVAFHGSSLEVERSEFRDFVSEPLRNHESLYAVQWVRRVSVEAREAYEQSVKRELGHRFLIREKTVEGRFVPAGRRQDYFPIHYVEPFDRNRFLLGVDHAAEPGRFRVMQEAAELGGVRVSDRVRLFHAPPGDQDPFGYLAYYPIYQNEVELTDKESRRRYLVGFIVGIYRAKDILASASGHFLSRGLELSLVEPGSEGKVPLPDPYTFEEKIRLLGREWRMVLRPTEEILRAKASRLPLGVLTGLLMLTFWVTAYLVVLRRHAARLAEVNEHLEGEVLRRKNAEEMLSRQAAEQVRINRELDRVNSALKHLASIDPLTGLLNRRGLEQRLLVVAAKENRLGSEAFALMVDLDDFKLINDEFGYVVGDMVLKEVGQRIKNFLRISDDVARIGGDEFVVLLAGVREAEAIAVAEKIRFQIAQLAIGQSAGHPIRITASIGVVPIDGGPVTSDAIIENASLTLLKGKRRGKNRVTVHEGRLSERAATGAGRGVPSGAKGREASLAGALESLQWGHKLYAVAQPIVRLRDRKTVGYEMLTRLDHQDFHLPEDFFQIAREAKILTVVDRSCLRVCLNAAEPMDPSLRIHVNIFPSTLAETQAPQILEDWNGIHRREGRLCLEISEQQIIGNPAHFVDSVRALKERGILISMDDVGFGSSCLESLILLEPDIVKIDKRCIQEIAKDAGKARSLGRLVRVVHSCNAEISAEGVESEEDLKVLLEYDIQYAQGFHLGRPARLKVVAT